MEIRKPEIKAMKYEDFNDNEYLEKMAAELRREGTNVIVGCLDELIEWGRSNSLWPLTFATSCCGIEFMAVGAARYDFARFGFEVARASPRQADFIMVAGTITHKMAPVLKRLYDQMADPKYVIAVGGCAISGGPFKKSYHVLNGVDKILPVDVYIPGAAAPAGDALRADAVAAQSEITAVFRRGEQADRQAGVRRAASPGSDGRKKRFERGRRRKTMNIREKITAWEPGAVWSEAGDGMFTVPVEKFHALAARLRAEGFDFLRSLTGMDWGEEGFGAVYHLEATATGENVVLRTLTPSREKCGLPSVCDLWKAAELNEREVFDYFGIGFLNHPDMRRLFLRDDWVGHPLRKDYDPGLNPLRMTNEVSKDSAPSFELTADGSFIRHRNVLFEEDEYVINIGPQHPATHGVLRFRVSLEGEIIRKLDVHCGYIHRGIEKMCESLTYPQTLALTDRLDYLGASQNRHALCRCIEKGLGVEVSERVQYIRTIMDELQRIDSHLLFFACLCMDMGALTAFFYGFRDREKVLDILEQTTGGRLIQTYNTIGGVQADIHPDFVRRVKEFIAYMRPTLREYQEVFTGNVIARERLKGTGVLTREDAVSFGATGGTGRASGWACDVRKRHPYAMYGKVDFEEVLYDEGDCFARYMVRMREIEQSMNIIEQLIDNIPEGEYQLKMKPVIRIPEGSYYAAVEGSRGEFGVFIESRGEKSPYRMKFRSTGLPLVSCLETIARGTKIADLIAIGGTLDYVVPDIDR